MSFTQETNFYYVDGALWKDIAKIVFTSKNIDTPADDGTRSNILPGEPYLALWYEDTSKMYRIEDEQQFTVTDYYNYIALTSTELDMDLPSPTVTVTGTTTTNNFEVFYEYVKDSIGCTRIGFTPVSMAAAVEDIRVTLVYSNLLATDPSDMGYLPNIYSTTVNTPSADTIDIYGLSTTFDGTDTHNDAWVVETIPGIPICELEIDLDKPYRVTKISMSGEYAYDTGGGSYFHTRFFGNYEIYGKLNYDDAAWTEILDTDNTTDLTPTNFLLTNEDFFQYYKIIIQNNTNLNTENVDTAYYALSALQFYTYEYNDTPLGDPMPMYNFKTNGDADIIYISDITELSSSPPTYELDIDSVTTATSGTLPIGTRLETWGSLTGTVDFQVTDSIVVEALSGEAYNCRLTAWDDVSHSTTNNELIAGDHVRVSAVAYRATNTKLDPGQSNDPINYVWGPVHNRILKGDVVYGGVNYFYGDFDLTYNSDPGIYGIYGDYLIFKPMLFGITSSISYGVHDYIITLHYSYT